MVTDTPAWLKSMEHGVLGEARARAFLMERFWVLSRSVDIDGADYLIQRRLTNETFLNREPPRLGVVQVKFIQDGDTYIRIPKSYLVDQDSTTYGEFFLLVCSGREDDKSMLLLSAAEVMKDFRETDIDGRISLVVKGSALLGNHNYTVLRQKSALDKIESALHTAKLSSNRQFLYRAGYVDVQPDHIAHDWLLPIDNDWGDIGKAFFDAKKSLRHTMLEMEDVIDAISKILRSTNPSEAISVYEEEVKEYIGGGNNRDSLMFRCDGFTDGDFEQTVRLHNEKLERLRDLKIENSYFALQGAFEAAVVDQLPPLVKHGAEAVRITISYSPDDLTASSVTVSVTQPFPKYSRTLQNVRGLQVVEIDLSKALPKPILASGAARAVVEPAVKDRMYAFRRPFQAALDKTYLGISSFWSDDDE